MCRDDDSPTILVYPPPGHDRHDPFGDDPGLDCGSEWSPEPDHGLSFGVDADRPTRRWRDRDVDVGDELLLDPDPPGLADPDELPF